MIRVSRRNSVLDHVAKARAIAAEGASVIFVGDGRHLRRMRDHLAPEVRTFLGTSDDGEAVLVVEGAPEDTGSLLLDHVPHSKPVD